MTAATQVEVLEQRCTDAEKTKEEAREAAAKVVPPLEIVAFVDACYARVHSHPSRPFPFIRSKRKFAKCTSSASRSWRC